MTEPEITTTVGPTGAIIESWPLGASVLAMRGIPFHDVPSGLSGGDVTRVRNEAPESAEVVSWKCEDFDPLSGPVWIDNAPVAEVSYDGGETWGDNWYTRNFARQLAVRLNAKFTES
jgi:hypothetical protein